jgi:inner membrane protease subunit 1
MDQAGGPSMLPTMSVVEWMIEESIRHEWFPQTLKRGQIVSFISPLDPNILVCKRILGMPGDTVLVDPTTLPAPIDRTTEQETKVHHVIVPKGHIWVQGDNASASRDSRTYGPVPIALVRGRLHCGIGVS